MAIEMLRGSGISLLEPERLGQPHDVLLPYAAGERAPRVVLANVPKDLSRNGTAPWPATAASELQLDAQADRRLQPPYQAWRRDGLATATERAGKRPAKVEGRPQVLVLQSGGPSGGTSAQRV